MSNDHIFGKGKTINQWNDYVIYIYNNKILAETAKIKNTYPLSLTNRTTLPEDPSPYYSKQSLLSSPGFPDGGKIQHVFGYVVYAGYCMSRNRNVLRPDDKGDFEGKFILSSL